MFFGLSADSFDILFNSIMLLAGVIQKPSVLEDKNVACLLLSHSRLRH